MTYQKTQIAESAPLSAFLILYLYHWAVSLFVSRTRSTGFDVTFQWTAQWARAVSLTGHKLIAIG